MSTALNYSCNADKKTFDLQEFINLFWNEPGLRRSIDKIYEIIVYSLFSVIVDELDVNIEVSLNPSKLDVLKEFETFAEKIICINSKSTSFKTKANINRVGVEVLICGRILVQLFRLSIYLLMRNLQRVLCLL